MTVTLSLLANHTVRIIIQGTVIGITVAGALIMKQTFVMKTNTFCQKTL